MEGEREVLKQDWQVLAGFWDEPTAMGFAQGQGVPLKPEELNALQNEFKIARDYVKQLPEKRDTPEVRPMEQELAKKLQTELEAEVTFKEHLAGVSEAGFGWVELSKLVVFQPLLNTTYIKSMSVPPEGDPQRVIEFCLPLTSKAPLKQAVQAYNATANTFTILTENLDLRIVGNVQGEDPQSHRKFVGFAYAGGLPQISVMEYKGRYILKNGYHRAFALLQAKHQFLPCLLLHSDNYAATGALAPGFFPVDLVLSNRAPFLSDFASPAAVSVPRRLLRVILSVHAEVQAMPV